MIQCQKTKKSDVYNEKIIKEAWKIVTPKKNTVFNALVACSPKKLQKKKRKVFNVMLINLF